MTIWELGSESPKEKIIKQTNKQTYRLPLPARNLLLCDCPSPPVWRQSCTPAIPTLSAAVQTAGGQVVHPVPFMMGDVEAQEWGGALSRLGNTAVALLPSSACHSCLRITGTFFIPSSGLQVRSCLRSVKHHEFLSGR